MRHPADSVGYFKSSGEKNYGRRHFELGPNSPLSGLALCEAARARRPPPALISLRARPTRFYFKMFETNFLRAIQSPNCVRFRCPSGRRHCGAKILSCLVQSGLVGRGCVDVPDPTTYGRWAIITATLTTFGRRDEGLRCSSRHGVSGFFYNLLRGQQSCN
ncbi:hypothetical protein EVAR_61341_1 [Eumeta japonica]|uniref:Uncharacterized protein n=1 Tax=Eumeta variegata TaxID=151549 RepID=A0A4C1Y0Z8_EUMVA|nr:hypothetical protein EVAR_61341_1 [Eumeta japonica]